ncbi:response regulator [Novipirellula maiorica]|uniref:response regulator n=1 Tax=Novipirellula maiorica TaxID=1265734 RepID=UPI000592B13E|nr:response regulator [Rhodopirellula maiorica]
MRIADSGRPAEVLLVEDNEDDVIITQRGFNKSNLPVNLHRVENGEECMQFLRKSGRYVDAPTPDLILLDLNMPVKDGREVLAEIVADEQLRRLAVVVLTTSESDQDLLTMYDLRCSSYILKPVDFKQFQQVIKYIGEYWFTIVVLPNGTTHE